MSKPAAIVLQTLPRGGWLVLALPAFDERPIILAELMAELGLDFARTMAHLIALHYGINSILEDLYVA
ncbi:MAG TPA: hypothetical protein VH186_08575 [Chloroflexia bacterium]|nr:hypothetical protein [Chloroflexia bacterium]